MVRDVSVLDAPARSALLNHNPRPDFMLRAKVTIEMVTFGRVTDRDATGFNSLDVQMASFFSLFDCDTSGGNRAYENRFQWFVVTRDEKYNLCCIQQLELKRLLDCVREPANHTAVGSLAKLLGISLERGAYDLFIEDIGVAIARTVFYNESVQNSDGFPDFDKTKECYYRKYCFFKFASFLDLLCPGVLHWRGQAQLESGLLVTGLARFLDADLETRTLMVSRWIWRSRLSAFSAKNAKQSQKISERQALLRATEDLKAADVALRLDTAGFRPRQ